MIKEFERIKKDEQTLLGWRTKRELAKINYRIHTDAIKINLIPPELIPQQTSIIYAPEAAVMIEDGMAFLVLLAEGCYETFIEFKWRINI